MATTVDAPGQDTGGTVARPVWSLERAMHRLWADHAIWTRNYVVGALAGGPDAEATAGRLLRNQDDIGNAIVRSTERTTPSSSLGC